MYWVVFCDFGVVYGEFVGLICFDVEIFDVVDVVGEILWFVIGDW